MLMRLRRGENECRYRHAVRVHARGRRLHVQDLRRRVENRRRTYDSSSFLALEKVAMAERVKQAATDFSAGGKAMFA